MIRFIKNYGHDFCLGEDIPVAAMREVYEETNIMTEFKSIVAVRHTHGIAFGCSDLYFIVELTPKSYVIKKCEKEIVDCKWMKVCMSVNVLYVTIRGLTSIDLLQSCVIQL